MADKAKFRAELLRWLWTGDLDKRLTEEEYDSDEFEAFEQGLKDWACAFVGEHQPERDQCGIPAHDFCFWCGKSMPGSWRPPAKAA